MQRPEGKFSDQQAAKESGFDRVVYSFDLENLFFEEGLEIGFLRIDSIFVPTDFTSERNRLS